MPIKWNACEVNLAMDKAEEFMDQAAKSLEQAKLVIAEARKINKLPGYVDQRLRSLVHEIERVTGGSFHNTTYKGSIRLTIELVRSSIPAGAVEKQRTPLFEKGVEAK